MITMIRNMNEKIFNITAFGLRLGVLATTFTALFLILFNVFKIEIIGPQMIFSVLIYDALYLVSLMVVGVCILKVYYIIVSKSEVPKTTALVWVTLSTLTLPLIFACLLSFAFPNYALAIAIFLYLVSLTSTITKNLFLNTGK